jgi:hypothetical protein
VQQSVGSGFAAYAFQVTARSCAVSNLTLAHEHGHNLGMEHDPANGSAPSSASYPWSFGHLVDGVFRTVMSYSNQCPSGCARAPYYSNPNVVYSGYPTGIVDQRDNARTANATTPVVAGFRSAPAASASQINLSWTDGSTDESGFYVERSTDGANFTQIGATGANTTTYSSTGLSGGTPYYYRVRAYNTAGVSGYTNVASTVTLASAPAAPGSFTGTALYTGSGKTKVFTGIRLNWVDVANNTGYNLERCKVSGKGSAATCTYSAIATPGANDATYTDSGAAALGTGSFRYRIRSFNTVGPSAWVGVSVTAN